MRLGVYRALGIPWCPPELREEPFRGEPPALLELARIRGDLHCHTTWSDGRASVEEMGSRGARARLRVRRDLRSHAGGWRRPRPERRRGPPPGRGDRRAPTSCWRRFACCAGSSATSSPTGGLTFPTTCSAELDWVQASVHGGQRMPRREMTKRVEEALRNPYVRCLSHPKGRYINRRPENALDLERVFEVALEHASRSRSTAFRTAST